MDLLRDIALFVEVSRTKNFRLAAKNLELPGSSLSRRIAALGRSVGIPLLTRTTRKVELTDAGRQYYQHCLAILEQSQLAIDELRQHHSKPSGLIGFSMPADFGLLFMPRVLDTFCAQYPQIFFELDLSPRRVDRLSELRSGATRRRSSRAKPDYPSYQCIRRRTLCSAWVDCDTRHAAHPSRSVTSSMPAHQ
jgi:DNA-binding transcriptional LysR family regulator